MLDVYNHVKHCTTHPKFLHSNSTSHRWVFGAIAELIDNAIDPDVSASQFCIDMKDFNGEPCLVFMDNGCGLVPEKLHKMLSFGHSKKQLTPGDRSIGKHGNGFKSGTMRLGKDVLVLTKCANSMTVGFLSQTFLVETGAEDILIPQLSWDLEGNRLSPMDLEIEESLKAICKFSIFPDEDSLLAQLEAIPVTGAILIISNLRRHEGVLELDFETDPHDIRIASEINSSHFQQLRPNQPNTTEVPMDYSLRAYVSILYKVPRMQIFIRDKKVKTKRIAGILSQKEIESYRPYGISESIRIELGFNTEDKALYGMMLYHRNRLIKAYMRVGMQLEENERGIGVIGLAEADFLQPTHNKQDFDDTTAYRRLLKKLSDVLAEYWWEKKERVHVQPLQMEPRTLRRGINVSTSEDVPDVIWVQCDNPTCLKWRILPPGTDVTVLPDIWYCEYHPEVKFKNHEEPEQEWDTSVQHEIVERRKERKREYDREKKEREAERKRQRLEAATRDGQVAVQQQREALAKVLKDQEAREQQAKKEQKRREEEMRKLNEEYAAMEAKRDEMLQQQQEIAMKLELTQAELAMKAKEKEDTGLLSTHQVRLEPQTQAGLCASTASENDNTIDEKQDVPFQSIGNSKVSRGPKQRQKGGNSGNGVSQIVTLLPSSDLPHQLTVVPNGNLNSDEACGEYELLTTGNSSAAAKLSTSLTERPGEAQALQPPHAAKTAAVASSRDLTARRPSGHPHQTPRKGTGSSGRTNGLQGALAEHRKRQHAKASRTTHPAGLQHSFPQEMEHPAQRLEARERKDIGEVSSGAVEPMPPTPSPGWSPSFSKSVPSAPLQSVNTPVPTVSGHLPVPRQQSLKGPLSSLQHRPTEKVDQANQDVMSLPLLANGNSIDNTLRELSTGQEIVELPSELAHSKEAENGDDVHSGHGASLSGLRLLLPQRQADMPFGSGLLSVQLPMDSMVSTCNSRSESELTLDKAVFSLQRRLRLALNTLVRIGGSGDVNLFELDILPSQDMEVVSICQKANEHVETRMQTYRQEVASLKAELAYLMADKMQNGQGLNFKIQSISNKWGIGAEDSNRG